MSIKPIVGGTFASVTDEMVETTGYRASKLLGADIYNAENEKVGKLDDFIIGTDDQISTAIISVGGFLGLGSRKVSVSSDLLEGNDKGQIVLPIATKEKLMALPEFRYITEEKEKTEPKAPVE
jgi:sporulation protein YlmC with PRC-barrel domain